MVADGEYALLSSSDYPFSSQHPFLLRAQERQLTEPFHAPVMCGGIFAMGREFFLASGSYDEAMDTWGGENFEMSFRLWMCGGEIVTVPCSRIAHVFRKKSPCVVHITFIFSPRRSCIVALTWPW